jgi:galactosylceramidase
MGRVNHVGTGYGFIPKGYFLQLGDDGHCSLVVIRGKKDKKKATGDAEQQALLKAQKDEGEGGEKILGTVQVPNVGPNQWHNLKLRFEGPIITGWVDQTQVLNATDTLYSHGMAGLMAGGDAKRFSTPYFDNLLIEGMTDHLSSPTPSAPGQSPIYAIPESKKTGGQ